MSTQTAAQMGSGLTFDVLVRWEREEIEAWARYFAAHPAAFDLPFAAAPTDDARMRTVRGVVHHIVAVERRYADRLEGAPVTDYAAIPAAPADALFDAARDANARIARWTAGASAAELQRIIEFTTISAGTYRATAHKIAAHALLHGVRTWAQVASAVRLGGLPGEGRHDFLYTTAMA